MLTAPASIGDGLVYQCFKVVRVDGNGSLISLVDNGNDINVEYKIGEYVEPKIFGSKLFVTYDVKGWSYDISNCESTEDYQIYRCYATNLKTCRFDEISCTICGIEDCIDSWRGVTLHEPNINGLNFVADKVKLIERVVISEEAVKSTRVYVPQRPYIERVVEDESRITEEEKFVVNWFLKQSLFYHVSMERELKEFIEKLDGFSKAKTVAMLYDNKYLALADALDKYVSKNKVSGRWKAIIGNVNSPYMYIDGSMVRHIYIDKWNRYEFLHSGYANIPDGLYRIDKAGPVPSNE